MLFCSRCQHIAFDNEIKNCEICYNKELAYFDFSLMISPENILFPKEEEKGYIPNIAVNYDHNRKLLEILFNYLKNKHLISRYLDIYINNYCIGRINIGVSELLDTSVIFQSLSPKIDTIYAVLPDNESNNFWKIDLKV